MKALFSSDCVVCHGSGRADANYRVTTYQQTMTLVQTRQPVEQAGYRNAAERQHVSVLQRRLSNTAGQGGARALVGGHV